MNDAEIKQRIDAFERWHYQFDLKGNLTPIFDKKLVSRHLERKRYFFDPTVELLGGSLAGKRVLDLGCNAGYWSLRAIGSRCDYVMGIDGRQEHVDQANFVFEVREIEKSRYDFVAGDLFQKDLNQFGSFDVVLCLGLMYHVSKPVELMEKIAEVNTDVLVIDTTLSGADGSFLEIRHETLDEPRHAVDRELVTVPTEQAVYDLTQQFGYSTTVLEPHFRSSRGTSDYRKGVRRAFLCAKRTNLSQVSAEVEPIRRATTKTSRVDGARR